MKIEKLKFQDFYLIKPALYKDNRGVFYRHFCEEELKKKNIKVSAKQGNISISVKKGTLRGFHYKQKPSKEYKVLSCLSGSLFHSAVDLRKNSKTFMKNFSITLKSSDRFTLIVPPSCANAFLTLEDNTTVHYYMGDFFEDNKYKGFRYNDPAFNIKWPFKPKVINERDKNYPDFEF
jgi:dTDP-4-dehydrorhamnose 3,5-epimerase